MARTTKNGIRNGSLLDQAEPVPVAVEAPPQMAMQQIDVPNNPAELLTLAVKQNLDVEKLGRLMELQERWNQQQAKAAFFAALAHFQSIVPRIPRRKQVKFEGRSGGTTDYFYAPLGDIDEVIRPAMLECGLSKRWEIEDLEDRISVTCIISHSLGHSEKTPMSAMADNSGSKNVVQARGSTVAYLQRYTLIGALGIATADQDIDARLGSLGAGERITKDQFLTIQSLIDETNANRDVFCQFFNIDNIDDLPASQYSRAVKKLEEKRDRR